MDGVASSKELKAQRLSKKPGTWAELTIMTKTKKKENEFENQKNIEIGHLGYKSLKRARLGNTEGIARS